MVRTLAKISGGALIAWSCLCATVAHAADTDAPADETAKEPSKDAPDAKPEASEDATPAEGEPTEAAKKEAVQEDLTADAAQGNSAAELPGKTYRFVGARYRGIIVPKFMQNLFADGGRTVYVHAFGPEFAIRKDGFEYNLSPWLALYSMKDTPFKGSSDGIDAWEIIRAKIQVLYLTSDFMWSHEFTPEFALNYGVGAGFGIVFGDLFRTQAYPRNGSPDDPASYVKCNAPGDPGPINGVDFCSAVDNKDHYGGYTEKSWANGGSKPLLFPWLALQTGLRFKIARNFASRLDLGFGTSGFFFGLGADYGL